MVRALGAGNPFFVNAQGFLRTRAPKRMSKLAYTPQLRAAVDAADQARQVCCALWRGQACKRVTPCWWFLVVDVGCQARVKLGQDRARRHEIRTARAKLSAEALAARRKLGMDLLRAKEAAIKARQGSAVANNPAAADAAAVAAAIGTGTCGLATDRGAAQPG